ALLKDHLDTVRNSIRLDARQGIVVFVVIGKRQVSEIAAFAAIAHVIHDDDAVPDPGIEAGDDIAADETGATRDHDHADTSSILPAAGSGDRPPLVRLQTSERVIQATLPGCSSPLGSARQCGPKGV